MLVGSFAFAQDPGEQDSIIIQTTQTNNPGEVFVWVYMRTDDSIAYYNMPLQFTASGTGITFDRVEYYPPLTNWDDTFFDYIEGEEFLRNFGFMDIDSGWNPPLHTNYNRLHTMNIVFNIDAGATDPQVVDIDYYDDPVNGPTIFGMVGGVIEISPAIVPGAIHYGIVDVEEDDILPTETGLAQNYPNPFNPATNVDFALPSEQHVRIDVYNILGQHIQTIADGSYPAGNHTVTWNGVNSNGENVPSGIYFYNMVSNDFSQTNKMMLLR
jgi:hypothetical protein